MRDGEATAQRVAAHRYFNRAPAPYGDGLLATGWRSVGATDARQAPERARRAGFVLVGAA
jgi:hypothetical protein